MKKFLTALTTAAILLAASLSSGDESKPQKTEADYEPLAKECVRFRVSSCDLDVKMVCRLSRNPVCRYSRYNRPNWVCEREQLCGSEFRAVCKGTAPKGTAVKVDTDGILYCDVKGSQLAWKASTFCSSDDSPDWCFNQTQLAQREEARKKKAQEDGDIDRLGF